MGPSSQRVSLQLLARMQIFHRDTCAHTHTRPFVYQTIETMDVKELELPQESDAEQKEKLKPGASQRGSLSLRQISHHFDKLSDHLPGDWS